MARTKGAKNKPKIKPEIQEPKGESQEAQEVQAVTSVQD